MSDCGVYLTFYEGEYFIDDWQIKTLDSDQKCCECGKDVAASEPIEEATWFEEYDENENPMPESARSNIYTCVVCAEIAEAFFCNGRTFNAGLWDQLYDVHSELTVGCFDRLTTPAAKAELQRRWMEWKGLTCR